MSGSFQMRIAQVAPLCESVPPKLYGGTERVVSWLTEELVRQGHDVTLFATEDSVTKAQLTACAAQGLRLAGIHDYDSSHLEMLKVVRARAEQFDVIHFHVDLLQFPLFDDICHKCVTTLHGRLDMPEIHHVYRAYPRMPLVSISRSQRRPMPAGLNWVATVHHGLPRDRFRFHPDGGDYLAFLGRVSPEKGLDRAIEVAKRTGVTLKVAAKIDPADRRFFEEAIEPLLDHPLVDFIGEIGDGEKEEFLGNALALLFPIDWPEPFGLVMIESMAVGTPVIAWRAGSVPEVIDDGLSGMIVQSIDEMVEAVARVPHMSRAGVRARFESRFTAMRMANDYLRAYKSCLAQAPDVAAPAKLGRLPALVDGARPRSATEPQPAATA